MVPGALRVSPNVVNRALVKYESPCSTPFFNQRLSGYDLSFVDAGDFAPPLYLKSPDKLGVNSVCTVSGPGVLRGAPSKKFTPFAPASPKCDR